MAMSMERLEKDAKSYAELNKELEYLRTRYRWWQDLFASQEQQEKILDDIKYKADKIKGKMEVHKLEHMPTITEMKQESIEDVADSVELLVLWCDAQLNKNEHLTDAQRMSLVEMILADFSDLRLEDVACCFRYAIRGDYGKVYNGLDVQVVLQWLKEYRDDLRGKRREVNERQHLSTKANPLDERISKSLRNK